MVSLTLVLLLLQLPLFCAQTNKSGDQDGAATSNKTQVPTADNHRIIHLKTLLSLNLVWMWLMVEKR